MRRIALGVAAVVLVVLGGVIQHLVDSSRSTPKPQSPIAQTSASAAAAEAEAPELVGSMDMGIAYGLTPNEVLRRIGAPTRKQGHCWVYSGAKMRGPRVEEYVDAMKFCFGLGPGGGKAVTAILAHMVAHTVVFRHRKLAVPAGWGQPLDFEPPPGAYVAQIFLP